MGDSPFRPKKKEKSLRRSSKTQVAALSAPHVAKPAKSSREEMTILVAKRAYELYCERGYRHGYALDDWLEAEREILSRIPP